MKQFFKMMCVLTLLASLAFSANKRKLKSEMKMDRMKRVEPDYRRGSASRLTCPHQLPNNVNSVLTVIDSSSNGYGMVATVTRPMDVNSNGDMLVVYRQYAGENTTHGQLGAGYGVVGDGEIQWDVQYNLNINGSPPWGGGGVGGPGTAQARYPSGIASETYPYAIWNEYTGNVAGWPTDCSSYGGRPYFSYDEFEWGGGSWFYPSELDPLYDCQKDLWTGSVGYGYDAASDEHHVSVVYDDWTRTGSYLFTSEAVDDGYIVLGTENLIVNPLHLGTDGYSSSAILSMNDNGQGLLGIDGIFTGVDMDAGTCGTPASNLTCNKTPMFKLTDNFGQLWQGNHGAFDFYYVPDEVFDDIFSGWPNEDVDPCTGEVSVIDDFWSWYEFDMRVDNDGNPHIVISLIAESTDYFHFLDGYTGFYHLTIDRDNLDSPGDVNSPTGWNWSYIPLPANNSFEWERPDGYSYLYGAMCQISLSRDNPNIVYMVANIATEGPMSAEFDANGDGVEDDPCGAQDAPYQLYPEWSEDIWVAKSSDNGSTWTGLENLTQTPRATPENDPYDVFGQTNNCSPEEQYVHTAHWSDDERVYFQYNQPNWGFNEIGDPLGADHMNRVFLGYSWVEETGVGGCTDETVCNYCSDCAFDDGSCANVLGTVECSDGTSGCDCNGDCYTYIEPSLQVEDCAGVCGGSSVQYCVAGGGGVECVANGSICSYSTVVDCMSQEPSPDCTEDCDSYVEVNNWTSCDNINCGVNHPAATAGNCDLWSTTNCNGGRCETCSDAALTAAENCPGWDPVATPANPCELACVSPAVWEEATAGNCDEETYGCVDVITSESACIEANGFWTPFVDDSQTEQIEEGGSVNECYCLASDAASACEVNCAALGDMNGDGGWNVLDIVNLANCVLALNCNLQENGCAGDMNGDGGYNVLDIVTLANCVLGGTCGGRVDDATQSKLVMRDNHMYIEADGFIGGVQMTLTHGDDFKIEMTDRALHADYLTSGNETRLLVITPETDNLFSYSGDFEIEEIIVANSHAEVSASLPMATSYTLSEAFPNPFNPTTTMTLIMPIAGDMQVEVYNLLGQVVATLASGYMEASTYTLIWDASDAASGMYFVKAHADGLTKTQKLMLVK